MKRRFRVDVVRRNVYVEISPFNYTHGAIRGKA
jgi:hypothetical protein